MQDHKRMDELTNGIKTYVNISCELIKLQATEKSASIAAVIISKVLIVMVGVLSILFISLGLGFYLSAYFGNNYIGFAMVAGFYFILGLILVLARKSLMERPLRNKIIKRAFCENLKEVTQ